MSDKYLTVKEWQKFAKDGAYKDAAFVKALAAAEKAEDAAPADQLKVLFELEDQGRALLKLHKADKKLEAYLEDVNKALKKYRKEAEKEVEELAAKEAAEGSDNDSPVLLQHAMIPLLRQVRKGDEMQALIGVAGKDAVVLISRRSIAPTRRELLTKWLGASGGVKWIKGVCIYEENAHTFVVEGAAAGLAKKLKTALLQQVELRLNVRVRGENADDIDQELGEPHETEGGEQESEAGDENAGAGEDLQAAYQALKKEVYPRLSEALREGQVRDRNAAVNLMGLVQKAEGAKDWADGIAKYKQLAALLQPQDATTPQPVPEDPAKADFKARLTRLAPLALAALKANAGDVSRIRAVMEFAREKGEAGNFKAGLAALDQLEKLLGTPGASASDTAPSTSDARPDPAAAFNARLAALMPRVKDALAAAGSNAQDVKLKVSEAGVSARKHEFDAANALLDDAERLLGQGTSPTGSTASSTRKVDPRIAFTQTRLDWERTRKQVQADLRRLEVAVLEACKDEPDFEQISANSGVLYTLLDKLDERLIDKLDDALNAADPVVRQGLHREASGIVDEYLDFVRTEPLIRDIDQSDFISMALGSTLTQQLGAMSQRLHEAAA